MPGQSLELSKTNSCYNLTVKFPVLCGQLNTLVDSLRPAQYSFERFLVNRALNYFHDGFHSESERGEIVSFVFRVSVCPLKLHLYLLVIVF